MFGMFGGIPVGIAGGGIPVAMLGGGIPVDMFGGGIPVCMLRGGGGIPVSMFGGGVPISMHGGIPVSMLGGGISVGMRCTCRMCNAGFDNLSDCVGPHPRHGPNCPRRHFCLPGDDEDDQPFSGHAPSTSRRSTRLDGHARTLYHQTSPQAAEAILASGRMRRGDAGLAGSGIYFAESPSETQQKAHQHGVVLQATVRLGRMKDVRSADSSATFASLQQEGFDSVRILGRPSGTEYVVYNYDQVTDIRRQR